MVVFCNRSQCAVGGSNSRDYNEHRQKKKEKLKDLCGSWESHGEVLNEVVLSCVHIHPSEAIITGTDILSGTQIVTLGHYPINPPSPISDPSENEIV